MAENTCKNQMAENSSKHTESYYVTDSEDREFFQQIESIANKYENRFNYVRVIKSRPPLLKWIMDKTRRINSASNLKTRIYMVLNDISEIPKCETCGKDFNVNIVDRT